MSGGTFWEAENLLHFTRVEFDEFLVWAFNHGASDILIESGEVLGLIKDGYVVDVGRKVLRYEELAGILSDVYQPASQSMLKSGKDLNFAYGILRDDDSLIRFRVNATSVQGGGGAEHSVEIVLRTIPSVVPDYKQLGLPIEVVRASKAEYGIILITGPTGSGKSTTVAALLRDIIETNPININTYESPIEFDLKSVPNRKARIKQTEIPTGLHDYTTAVENSLRRAQKVVLFGEAREKAIFEACIREAETGHLVFTTVHANDVPSTISRFVGMFTGEESASIENKLAGTLRMILNQRLYPKRGGGRVAIREYLIFDDEMRRHLQMTALKPGAFNAELMRLVAEKGVPMLRDAKKHFSEGTLPLGQYAGIVSEVGSIKDLDIVPDVAEKLLSQNIIDKPLYDQWLSEYNEAIS